LRTHSRVGLPRRRASSASSATVRGSFRYSRTRNAAPFSSSNACVARLFEQRVVDVDRGDSLGDLNRDLRRLVGHSLAAQAGPQLRQLEQREGRPVSPYGHQQRILPATRTQPAWAEVELAWEEAEHTLQPLIDITGKLSQGVAEIQEVLAEEHEELSGSLANLYRRMSEFQDQMNGLVFEPAEGEKCARCWKILPDVGHHAHPGVCNRCDDALGGVPGGAS